jgi:di/tricarboxylate transporter
MSDATVSLSILAVVVVLFVWNRFPVELVAVGAAIALYFSGVLTLNESLAGFGDPAVILIAALFVVSEGLDATGVTTWLGRTLAEKSGGSARRLLVFTMLLSAGLTALIGLNGTVAALLPMAVVMVAVRRDYPTSQLLMPLAFAGSAGGLLLLTGSPVNVVISEAAADAGVGPFGLAEFALVGIPLVAGTVLIVLALGKRLLPKRESSMVPPDLSRQAAVLVEHYSLDNVFHLRAGPSSGLLGKSRARWDLESYPGIKVITVLDAASQRPVSDGLVGTGDRITVVGNPDVARRYAADYDLRVEAVRSSADITQSLLTRESGAAEVVIPPRSRFVGTEVNPGKVVLGGNVIILAIDRQGKDQGPGTTVLQAGDALLVEGDWATLTDAAGARDVLLVDCPDQVRRQAVPLGRGSFPAIVVLAAMIILLATAIVSPALAALLAAGAMIVLRVISVQQAYRGISWTTVLLVAGMIPMSTAITKSGSGATVAEILVGAVGGAGPLALLAALFVLTVIFGQLISNTATALVVIPIAVSAAAQLGVSARPVLMSVCVAAAAAFLTPVATPANMMVMGPGGYRFGDYWRLGLVLVLLFFIVSVGLVPLVWRF